jgi:monoamine oxidase
MPNSSGNKADVLIIGAGVGGLTAAANLSPLGLSITILEARNRVGGRIDSQNHHQTIMELGTLCLFGKGTPNNPNPLLGLFKRYGIETEALDPFNSDFFTTTGEKTSFAEWYASLKEPIARANDLIQSAKPLESNKATKSSLASVLHLNSETQAKSSKDNENRAKQLLITTIQRNTGADPKDVSLLEVMHDGTFAGADELILNGAHKFIDGLLKDCEAGQNFNLILKSNVKEIHYSSKNAQFKVKTETGEEYQAKVVLCAVPLGVLKKQHIQFFPALSKAKQKALRHLSLGEKNHVFMEFDKAFWSESVHYLFPNDPAMNQWPEYINLMPFNISQGRPILLANMFGPAAKFSKKNKNEIIETVLAPLRRVYKNAVSYPKAFSISHWDADRFTASAIPYCGLLCSQDDLFALQEPETNGLYFAGDYTYRGQRQSINAAYESGLKAAMEIAIKLKYQEQPTEPSTKESKSTSKKPKL